MKKISWRSIGNRITGFSLPFVGGGLNWIPPALDAEVASNLLTYLEDRRVLFNPWDAETPLYVTNSVQQIRERLNTDLQATDRASDLFNCIRGMRAACLKFLDVSEKLNPTHNLWQRGLHPTDELWLHGMHPADESLFMDALGQFRGVMGVYIARLSAAYQLDVDSNLMTIIPPADIDQPDDA